MYVQGCIIRSILPSGMGARGVSSEHVDNMEMFSCSPTKVRSDSQRTVLWLLENRALVPSDTLIYGISRDSSKKFNLRTFEHMIHGQLRMGACQTKNAPLPSTTK